MASSTFSVVEVLGQRQLHQDAVDLRVGVELGDLASTTAGGRIGGYSIFSDCMPAFSQPATLLRT
jgi:hypothetical protein